MLSRPSYIASRLAQEPLQCIWNKDLAYRFYSTQYNNHRFLDKIEKMSYKARLALGIAIAEWIVWRFEGQCDLTDALHRIEAAWAGAIDQNYSKDLDLELFPRDHKTPNAKGVVQIALGILDELTARNRDHALYVGGPAVGLSELALHVIPGRAFVAWQNETVRRAIKCFPRDPQDDDEQVRMKYDASHEAPVPREFFDPAFKFSKPAAKKKLGEWIKNLDRKNPYLKKIKKRD